MDGSSSCKGLEEHRLAIYSVLVCSTVLLHFVRGLMFYFICINASRVLHNRMFRNMLRVPVKFFDFNPSGMILFVIMITSHYTVQIHF